MKKRGPASAGKDLSKLKARLALRERQFAVVVKGLKSIIAFRSAHLSVFETEVHALQRQALESLIEAENLQREKKLVARPVLQRALLPVRWRPLFEDVFKDVQIRGTDDE